MARELAAAIGMPQQRGGIALLKHSRNAGANQLRGYQTVHARCDYENLSLETLFSCQSQKLSAITRAKIEVEENDMNGLTPQDVESLVNGSAVSSNLESRFRVEQPT